MKLLSLLSAAMLVLSGCDQIYERACEEGAQHFCEEEPSPEPARVSLQVFPMENLHVEAGEEVPLMMLRISAGEAPITVNTLQMRLPAGSPPHADFGDVELWTLDLGEQEQRLIGIGRWIDLAFQGENSTLLLFENLDFVLEARTLRNFQLRFTPSPQLVGHSAELCPVSMEYEDEDSNGISMGTDGEPCGGDVWVVPAWDGTWGSIRNFRVNMAPNDHWNRVATIAFHDLFSYLINERLPNPMDHWALIREMNFSVEIIEGSTEVTGIQMMDSFSDAAALGRSVCNGDSCSAQFEGQEPAVLDRSTPAQMNDFLWQGDLSIRTNGEPGTIRVCFIGMTFWSHAWDYLYEDKLPELLAGDEHFCVTVSYNE